MRVAAILVVDDDADVREAMAAALEAEGSRRRTGCERRRRALLPTRARAPFGWQFHREMQADAAIATIPVVVLSAWRDGDAPVPVDASRFLPKPVEVKELLSFAARYCQ